MSPLKPPFVHLRALVADDDQAFVELVAVRLREAGFEVETALRGDDALTKLRQFDADVCVLDLMLPGIDGWRILTVARREQISTPIVVVSGRSGHTASKETRALGADAHLVKPVSLEALARRAVRLARRRRQQQIDHDRRPLVVDDLVIDPTLGDVRVGGAPIGLTNFEFEVLYMLALRYGVIVSRADLIALVWPGKAPARAVVDQVGRIRAKLLKAGADPDYVRRHPEQGYEFLSPFAEG